MDFLTRICDSTTNDYFIFVALILVFSGALFISSKLIAVLPRRLCFSRYLFLVGLLLVEYGLGVTDHGLIGGKVIYFFYIMAFVFVGVSYKTWRLIGNGGEHAGVTAIIKACDVFGVLFILYMSLHHGMLQFVPQIFCHPFW